MTPPRPPLSLA
uniref:Uncharacterized protein n=1 Tax=Oryza punctata TaxID=4537 RepID=A0A0E0KCY3_ORYPU